MGLSVNTPRLIAKLIYISLLLLFTFFGYGQVSSVQFGKNRVQYHDDFDQWSSYESENIRTFWYGKSRNIGFIVAKVAENEYPEILDLLEHKINQKIQILVFSDVTDENQSNIGKDELLYNESDLVPIHENKVFVHYNGDQTQLRQRVREGMCGVLLHDMYFGGGLDVSLQVNYAKKLPKWYLDGMISFAGSEWNAEKDNAFRKYYEEKGELNFKKMSRDYPVLAGHSFWYYLASTYSKDVIPNLLYLTKINRDLEEAFDFVFGVELDQMIVQWQRFFESIYTQGETDRVIPIQENQWKLWKKGRAQVTGGEYSPDGHKIAYSINHLGKYRVYVKDLQTNQLERIFTYGTRNPFLPIDVEYPAMRWMNNRDVAIIFERRDQLYIRIYNTQTEEVFEQLFPERFERIYGFDVIDDRYIVISAQSMSNIDLYRYDLRTRQSDRFMNDYFADMYPEIVRNDLGTFISFQSNRDRNSWTNWQSDSLTNIQTADLWMMDLNNPIQLFPVIQTSSSNERLVKSTPEQLFFLTTETGITNLATIAYEIIPDDSIYVRRYREDYFLVPDTEVDSVDPGLLFHVPGYQVRTSEISFLSNVPRHLKSAFVSAQGDRATMTYLDMKDRFVTFEEPTLSNIDSIQPIAYYQYLDRKAESRKRADSISLATLDTTQIFQTPYTNVFTNTYLDSLFRSKTEIFTNLSYNTTQNQVAARGDFMEIQRTKVVPYRWQFSVFESSFDVSNEILFDGLDSYAAEGGTYRRAPTGLLGKVVIKDLFEDYEFEGGVRFPPNFNGAEYYGIFRDNKHRLDKSLSLYRKVQTERNPTASGLQGGEKYEVLLGQAGVSYALDFYNSVRAKFTLRQDRNTVKPTTVDELNLPPDISQRIGLKLEYVYDNSYIYNPNIRNGTRAKIYGEVMKKLNLQLIEDFKFQLGDGYLTTFGVDARHYLPVLKHSVLALRVGAGISMGTEKILFYLGGADNEIIPQFNEDGRNNYRYTYAYQTVAPSLRGFKSNVRSGNNHLLSNVEFRIPPFQYFFGKNMQSRILRDFQLVGFFDFGMAWEGRDPYDPNNPINFVEIDRPPILHARVQYFRDPFVMGYGAGVRINLLGYFLRGDYAWGVDSGAVLKPRIHISLGYDF